MLHGYWARGCPISSTPNVTLIRSESEGLLTLDLRLNLPMRLRINNRSMKQRSEIEAMFKYIFSDHIAALCVDLDVGLHQSFHMIATPFVVAGAFYILAHDLICVLHGSNYGIQVLRISWASGKRDESEGKRPVLRSTSLSPIQGTNPSM